MSSISSITSQESSLGTSLPSDGLAAGIRGRTTNKSNEKQPQTEATTIVEAESNRPSSSLDDDEVQVEKVKKAVDFSKATLDDVVISDEAVTPFCKWNKKKKGPIDSKILSKLVSILGVAPHLISQEILRKFCTANNITGMSSAKKPVVVQAIVRAKLNPPAKKTTQNKVNRKRYIECIFCDRIRPKIATKGQTLSKDQMTDGLKTDELLHRQIIVEYNDPTKHNEEAHTHLVNCKGDPPGKFYGPIDWKQSKEILKSLLKDYDICVANWKLSGNHGAFGENEREEEQGDGDEEGQRRKPFSDFVRNQNILLYLHEYVYQFPNVFEKVTGDLPEGAFTESTNPRDIGLAIPFSNTIVEDE